MEIRKSSTRGPVGALFVVLALAGAMLPKGLDGAMGDHASAQAGVVLELFTAQGCSSCPPADRLLAKLAEVGGAAIVPLAYHVDSWNHLGWTDPFSRKAWTLRHEAYSRVLGQVPYTPQAVVEGRVAMVGSDEDALWAALAEAVTRPAARLTVATRVTAESLDVGVGVELPELLSERKLDVMVAVFETGLRTDVGFGENGGRSLDNDYVVRRLERAGRLRPSEERHSEHHISIGLAADWDRGELGVAAFVQEPGSLAIHGGVKIAVPR